MNSLWYINNSIDKIDLSNTINMSDTDENIDLRGKIEDKINLSNIIDKIIDKEDKIDLLTQFIFVTKIEILKLQ